MKRTFLHIYEDSFTLIDDVRWSLVAYFYWLAYPCKAESDNEYDKVTSFVRAFLYL